MVIRGKCSHSKHVIVVAVRNLTIAVITTTGVIASCMIGCSADGGLFTQLVTDNVVMLDNLSPCNAKFGRTTRRFR